jgi:HD-like signal output (HDOD) protein
MLGARTVEAAAIELVGTGIEQLIKSIPIPPRPVVVEQLQSEMARAEPDLRQAAHIVSQDVGLTVAVLKTVNSPMYGLSRRAESVEQAIGLIGLRQLSILVSAMAMRTLLKGDTQMLERFYDASARRAFAMARMAKSMEVDVTLAQTFGLFCDVGIPLLMHRFPDYKDTLKVANTDAHRAFTAVEHAAHHTDHALIGALMVKTWNLPPSVAVAIRVHHDYDIFLDPKIPREIARLVSLGMVADEAIGRFTESLANVEWAKGGDYVASTLSLEPDEVEEWIESLVDAFSAGID